MRKCTCRDCTVCTRPAYVWMLLAIPKLIYTLTLRWNVGIPARWFRRYCPECGHWLSQHQRLSDGRFKD